jgi:hypothetical protein
MLLLLLLLFAKFERVWSSPSRGGSVGVEIEYGAAVAKSSEERMVRGLACNPHCTQLQYNLYYRCGQQGGQLCDQCTLYTAAAVRAACCHCAATISEFLK